MIKHWKEKQNTFTVLTYDRLFNHFHDRYKSVNTQILFSYCKKRRFALLFAIAPKMFGSRLFSMFAKINI